MTSLRTVCTSTLTLLGVAILVCGTVDAAGAAVVAAPHSFSIEAGTSVSVAAPGLLSGATGDPGDTLTVESTLVEPPAHGTVTLHSDGSLSFEADATYAGPDSFTYAVCNQFSSCGSSTVSITITGTTPRFGGPSAIAAMVGVPMKVRIPVSGLPIPNVSDKGRLPAGLRINRKGSHWFILGTPIRRGRAVVMLTASNGTPSSATKRLTFSVQPLAANVLTRVATASWHTYITDEQSRGRPWDGDGRGGSGFPRGNFYGEYYEPSQVVQRGGQAMITSVPKPVHRGYSWTSGVLSSYGKWEIDGGYVEINAKIPDTSDGAWPAFWLLDGPGNNTKDEIDIFEGGLVGDASGSPNDNFEFALHTNRAFGQPIDTGVNLAAGFHRYAIYWVPGNSVTWFIDGRPIARLTSRQAVIPKGPMELIINLQVATSLTRTWHTVASSARTQRLVVESVRYSRGFPTAGKWERFPVPQKA